MFVEGKACMGLGMTLSPLVERPVMQAAMNTAVRYSGWFAQYGLVFWELRSVWTTQ